MKAEDKEKICPHAKRVTGLELVAECGLSGGTCVAFKHPDWRRCPERRARER